MSYPQLSYPMLEERALPPAERRGLWRPLWRDPAGLPPLPAGAVYVFEYDGRYRDPYARRVNGSEPHVIDATAVCLVEIRDRRISVHRAMASARPGIDLLLSVTFRCTVTNPAAVAQAGISDLETMLAAHVAADRELVTLGRHVWPERAADARVRAEAQLRAHCVVNPPDVIGVECTVAAVDVRADTTYTTVPQPVAVAPQSADTTQELSLHEQVESRLSVLLGARPGVGEVARATRTRRDGDNHG